MNPPFESPERQRRKPPNQVAQSLRRAFAALEARGASIVSLGILLVCGIVGYLQIAPNGPMVALLLAVVVFEFQKRIDQGLPLMQVASVLATLQWCVGPAIAYWGGIGYDRYMMYVEEELYFSYALPGTAAFVIGLLSIGSSVKQRGMMRDVPRGNFVSIGMCLFAIGLVGRFGGAVAPGALAFAFHLLSQMSYVAVLYFLFSRSPLRWLFIALCLAPLFKQTAASAMFHDLLLWMGLLFCYWYGMRKRSFGEKVALLSVVGISLFTIQAVKESYRAKLWKGQEASFVTEVIDLWTGSGERKVDDDHVLANVVVRLNQGWIISAVMWNVPTDEPYARGETLVDAVAGAFIPRFLWADKAEAGGQVNFRRFTGLNIADSTSMAISPLGEAYANYGREGGVGLMLLFGLGFASAYSLCLRWSVLHPDFLFWIPLIFYQAIKAETEFVTVLNQLSKGAVIAFGIYWVLIMRFVPMFFPAPAESRRRLRRPPTGRRHPLPEYPEMPIAPRSERLDP